MLFPGRLTPDSPAKPRNSGVVEKEIWDEVGSQAIVGTRRNDDDPTMAGTYNYAGSLSIE